MKERGCEVDPGVAGGIQQQITGFQVPVEDVGRVDVLQTLEGLVEEVADLALPRC